MGGARTEYGIEQTVTVKTCWCMSLLWLFLLTKTYTEFIVMIY